MSTLPPSQIHQNFRCDLVWKRSLEDLISQDESYWIRMGPVFSDWYHHEKPREGGTQREHQVRTEEVIRGLHSKPRNAKDYQQWPEAGREAWDRFLLRVSRRTKSYQLL